MKKSTALSPSPATRTFLRIALSILILSSVTLLVAYLGDRAIDPITAKYDYRPLLEYPIAGLTITAGGSFLIEYIERDLQK